MEQLEPKSEIQTAQALEPQVLWGASPLAPEGETTRETAN
jgi:hypothetical protein